MNKQKGFTLIELLAVIVILAIIALIATPIVLNIIKESKESATLQSAEFYLGAVENAIAKDMLDGTSIEDGTYNIMEDGNLCLELNTDKTCKNGFIEIEVSGETPSSGTIKIEKGKRKGIKIKIQDKTIIEKDNKLVFTDDNDRLDGLEVYYDGEIEFTYDSDAEGYISSTILEIDSGVPMDLPGAVFRNLYLIVDGGEPIELVCSGYNTYLASDGSRYGVNQAVVEDETGNDINVLSVLLPEATGKHKIVVAKSTTEIPDGFVQIRSNGYAAICDLDFIAGDAYIEIYDSEGTVYLEKDSGPYTFRQEGILYGIQNINEYENPLPNLTSVYTALANGKEITIKVTQTVDGEDRVTIYDGTSKYIESVGGWPTYFWGNSFFEQSFT